MSRVQRRVGRVDSYSRAVRGQATLGPRRADMKKSRLDSAISPLLRATASPFRFKISKRRGNPLPEILSTSLSTAVFFKKPWMPISP